MQREARWESLARRRTLCGSALLLALVASYSFPASLKGEGRSCNAYGPKEDPAAMDGEGELPGDEPSPELFFEPEAESAAGCRIDISVVAPAQLTLDSSTNVATARLEVTLRAGNSEPGTPAPIVVQADYGDGVVENLSGLTLPVIRDGRFVLEHLYGAQGAPFVKVNIYGKVNTALGDCRPLWNFSEGVTINVVKPVAPLPSPDQNPPPSTEMAIRLNPGDAVQVNDDLNFTVDGASDPDYYYNWTFDDGTTFNAKSFVRRYNAPGLHSADLEIWKFSSNAWRQIGTTLTTDFEVKRGLHIVASVPASASVGPNRDMALSEFRGSNGVLHRVAWVAGAGKIAVVNIDTAERPTLHGELRSVKAVAATATTVARYTTGHLAIAATDKLVALADQGYGVFLFDAQRLDAPLNEPNSLVQVGRLSSTFAGDLCFNESGTVLFAVNGRGIVAYDVAALSSRPSDFPSTYSPPILASIGDGGYYSVHVLGDTVFAGQQVPLSLSVFTLRDDNRDGAVDRFERVWQQTAAGLVDRQKLLYQPRAIATHGSLLAINERTGNSYGGNSAMSFFDITDPKHPVFRSRVGAWGTNYAGVALVDGATYTMNSAVVTEIDTSQPGAERVKEQLGLSGLGPYGWGYRILADSRGYLFAGMSGSPLLVLDPNPAP